MMHLTGALVLSRFSFRLSLHLGFLARAATLHVSQRQAKESPTVGGFVTLSSLSIGLLISAVRWLIIDRLHHWTGLNSLNAICNLKDKDVFAFQGAVENHRITILHKRW
jgi:hypothetical protein